MRISFCYSISIEEHVPQTMRFSKSGLDQCLIQVSDLFVVSRTCIYASCNNSLPQKCKRNNHACPTCMISVEGALMSPHGIQPCKRYSVLSDQTHSGNHSRYILSNTIRRKVCDTFAPESPLLLAYRREVHYYRFWGMSTMQKIQFSIKPAPAITPIQMHSFQ